MEDPKNQAEYVDLYNREMSKRAEAFFKQWTSAFFTPFKRMSHYQTCMDGVSPLAIRAHHGSLVVAPRYG